MRRAGACRRRVSGAADPQGVPRRHMRTDGGSRRSQEARHQVGRETRRGPPGHARHADRGQPARRAGPQLLGGAGTGRPRPRRRLARHVDRRLLYAAAAGRRCGGSRRDAGADRSRRAGRAGKTRGAGRSRRNLPRARRERFDPAGQPVRFAECATAADRALRSGRARRLRRFRARRAGRGRRAGRLCRADPGRQAAPSGAAAPGVGGRADGNRRGGPA